MGVAKEDVINSPFMACECKVNTRQKIVVWSILGRGGGAGKFILLCGTGNIERMSEVKFVLPRNDGKHVHISSAHIS